MGLSFDKKSLRGAAAIAAVSVLALGLPTLAAADENVITLGSAISLTGKYSSNGIDTQNGYDLAVKKINDMGGVKIGDKTYTLAVKYYDDESTPARTAQLLERLIEQDGIKFILGPYSSATTIAAAPVVEKYKVPMIEAEGASRALFNKGYKYIPSRCFQHLSNILQVPSRLPPRSPKRTARTRRISGLPWSLKTIRFRRTFVPAWLKT